MNKAVIIDQHMLDRTSEQARIRPRKRCNYNLHSSYNDPVQRFLNALEPNTYIRPHFHETGRWESFIILRGSVGVLTFDQHQNIASRTILSAGGDNISIEIPGGTWHSMYTTETNSVVFEFKQGPYIENGDKNFARWAPSENDEHRFKFVEWFINGEIGSKPPVIRD